MNYWPRWFFRKELWVKGYYYYQEKGLMPAYRRLVILFQERLWETKGLGLDNAARYKKWWQSQELTSAKTKKIKECIRKFSGQPVISVLVPVYNTPPDYLEECLKSVRDQLYPHWELCVVDDSSSKKETQKVLARWKKKSRRDPRIKIFRHSRNRNISHTTNSCLKLAKGDFVSLMDHDDKLHRAALFLVAKCLNERPDTDFIYSDEDKLDWQGEHCDPYFKSDWNPDLLLSTNYFNHLTVVRKSLMQELGGMRVGFEGSQDYDFYMRLMEKTDRITHIPHVLYHWRKVKGSTSFSYFSKGYADRASLAALRGMIKRRGEQWKVRKGLAPCSFQVIRCLTKIERVAIVIPFRDQAEVLERCVSSILAKTSYPNYKIYLVDNLSEEPATKEYLARLRGNKRIVVWRYPHPFNFSALNNWAAQKIQSPLVLFLNNDTSVINGSWLNAMVEHIGRAEVGAVGAKLLYPNGKIQHAGVVLGVGKFKDKPNGIAGHAFKGFPKGSHGYFEQIDLIRDVSAVTAACMLTRRKLFLALGGFDEKNFTVAWNDVDYCLKLREKGYLVVYTPYAGLNHYESLSRGSDERGEKMKRFHQECEVMYARWGEVLGRDPYYNPNLSLEDESFRICKKAAKDIYC